jgi:hypothetical protein
VTVTATTPELLRYLADSVPWLAHRKDEAEDAFDELDNLAHLVERTIDTKEVGAYAGPCDVCGRDMYARPGKRVVQCVHCNLDYDLAPRRDWLLKQAEDRLEPAIVIAKSLTANDRPVTAKRIRDWADREILEVKGHDRHGHRLFRVGDVQHLVENPPRRGRKPSVA